VNDMKQSLKQAVCDKFESYELNVDQLATLERQIDTSTENESSPRRISGWPGWLKAAAAMFILSVGGFFADHLYQEHRTIGLLEDLATEVVENHLKLKPLEVESQSLIDVLDYFDRLEFQLLESSQIAANAGDRLLGGRYCSIQGIDAAQLRVASADGKLSTWYQATLPAKKLTMIPNVDKGDPPAMLAVKGMQVRIWQEQGVVFAEARQPDTNTQH
jgi:hypothetical protein